MKDRPGWKRLPPIPPRGILVAAVLLLAFLAGIGLRLYRLDAQILLGDELHAVRVVESLDLREIVTSYREADHCIPLAALYELRTRSGAALGDAFMRLPGMLAGIVFLLAVPLMLGRWLGWDRASIVAWLFALSPGLVLYSRIARPYMPATLLAILSILAFYAWWRSCRHRWAVAYIAAAALTFWFSPVMAPLLGAPFLFAVLRKTFVPRRGPGLGALAVAAVGLALAIVAVLAPAWESFFELLGTKAVSRRPGLTSLQGLLALQAGSGHAWVALAVWATGLGGLILLARRRADFALLTAVAVSVQGVALWMTSPFGLASPLVWNRYLLPAVPLLLLWVAEGLAAAVAWIPARVRLRPSLVPLLIGSWFVAGPFTDPEVRWSSFLHGNSFLGFHTPAAHAGVRLDFPVYRHIGDIGGAVVEVPGLPTWRGPDIQLLAYQSQHRQPVVLAPYEGRLFGPELRLRHYVEPRAEAILAAPARWVVVHLDPTLESALVGRSIPPPEAGHVNRMAQHTADLFAAAWGPPDLTSQGLRAWDLDRIRQGSHQRTEASP